MAASARLVGLVLLIAGIVLGLAGGAWLIQGVREENIETSGALLGLIILLGVVVLPLAGGGAYFVVRGWAEAKEFAEIDRQRRLLDILLTRGQVSLTDLVFEMKSNREEVEADLYALVGRGLFSGYVDWKSGMLYSVEASKLQGASNCPNCGGKLELAGKGLIKCPYCGAEIFLA
jgi:ribosomal protein S27AE